MKKVVIIYDDKYEKEFILAELKAEGFPYQFKLFSDPDFTVHQKQYLGEADEVWCFGKVEHLGIYNECIKMGSDVWKMG